MDKSTKCHKKDDNTFKDIHFETWTGRENPETRLCTLSSQRHIEHVVGITNWTGFSLSVTAYSKETNQTVLFDYPRGSSNQDTSWERNQRNPIYVPAAPPRGPTPRISDAANAHPNNVSNRPNQVIKVEMSYKPHLPTAGWNPVPTLDILVDIP